MTTLEEQRDWLSGFPNSSTFDAKSDMVNFRGAHAADTDDQVHAGLQA